jgi:hypothetical protein
VSIDFGGSVRACVCVCICIYVFMVGGNVSCYKGTPYVCMYVCMYVEEETHSRCSRQIPEFVVVGLSSMCLRINLHGM